MKKLMIAICVVLGLFISTQTLADTLIHSSNYPPNVELWLESYPDVPDDLNLVYYTEFTSPYPSTLAYNPNVHWDYAIVFSHSTRLGTPQAYFAYIDSPEYDGILTVTPSISGIRNISFFDEPATAVPEPATMFLLGSGLIGLARYGRKKFSKK